MAKEPEGKALSIGNRELLITNPAKLYFSQAKISKLDLVRYYLSVAPGAIAAIRDRPIVLKRFVNGALMQKRSTKKRAPGEPSALVANRHSLISVGPYCGRNCRG